MDNYSTENRSNSFGDGEKSSLLASKSDRSHSISSVQKQSVEFPSTVEVDRSLYIKHTTTPATSLMHVIKGNLGIGAMSLPLAMMNAGILVGPLLEVIIAIVTVHCMFLLVQCSHAQSYRTKSMALDYAEVAEKCIGQYYPTKKHLGRYMVNTFLLITEFGFCCIYILFVAQSLHDAFKDHVSLDVKEWVGVLLGPIIILSCIRTLKLLSCLSALSNVLYIVGVTCLLVYAGETISDPKVLPLFAGWKTLPLTFGTVMMTFEGIGVILPVENMMAKPRYFYCVLNLGMGLVTLLYMSMSVLGYLSCKEDCKDSFTLNLSDSPYHTAIKLLLAASIFSSYFIQFYVPMSIIIPPLKDKVSVTYKPLVEYGIRVIAVCGTASLAVGIPQLGNLISLIGAIGSTALAVILPALFHILTFRYDNTLSTLSLCKDLSIIIVGIFAAAAALFTSVVNIIQGFEHKSLSPINGNHSHTSNYTLL